MKKNNVASGATLMLVTFFSISKDWKFRLASSKGGKKLLTHQIEIQLNVAKDIFFVLPYKIDHRSF